MQEWDKMNRRELIEQAVLRNVYLPLGYDDRANGNYVPDDEIRDMLLPLAIEDNRTVAAIAAAQAAPAAAARALREATERTQRAAVRAAAAAAERAHEAPAQAALPAPPAPAEAKYVPTAAERAAREQVYAVRAAQIREEIAAAEDLVRREARREAAEEQAAAAAAAAAAAEAAAAAAEAAAAAAAAAAAEPAGETGWMFGNAAKGRQQSGQAC